jgi:hypothetical protein
MSSRLRKLAGLALLLPFLALYLGAAALIGERIPARWYFEVPYYALAGVLWAFPAMVLLRWTEGRGSRSGTSR